MNKTTGYKTIFLLLLLSATIGSSSQAQIFNTLINFDGPNGAVPYYGALSQGRDGRLYGTTQGGGAAFEGTVFAITPAGLLTTTYSFCFSGQCTDGFQPLSGLVLAADGSFYGTTLGATEGNQGEYGTVFKITSTGKLTTLHVFDLKDNGIYPYGTLIQATNGDLLGTTGGGGTSECTGTCGTIFKITPRGTLTTLHVFDYSDGNQPFSGLTQGLDGSFYGTTSGGGEGQSGTVFKITSAGKLTTLHNFSEADGKEPIGALMQGANGQLYGTTRFGGDTSGGGTVFQISPQGTFVTIYSFCKLAGCADGAQPFAGLVQGTDGNLYGTTAYGGGGNCDDGVGVGCGTVFKIAPSGVLTTLHKFQITDGASPYDPLVQDSNGTFYGSTNQGGSSGLNEGTLFSLDVGLSPFVRLVRNSGKVGQAGGILGQGFTGTTVVSFNGVQAPFIVVSDTFLKATVPSGALSGELDVITPTGLLRASKPFRVTPQLLSFSPTSGPIGTVVTLTGVSLTQASGVGFGNYSPASFTVNSDTQVTATVPSGAKTGRVGVQTQGGTAISSGTFTVTQ